ncbi:hypothetical protein EXU57_03615 [Segetibacter sp. 3557_3]|uniref:hypothetical protein n=1 Tax=Segetibacter sp. 3557_3 TaxID=2547429 RepID=UPI001058BF0A|nr:hypothetical protein [Segetibacter sp. 3557_3]TDH29167.1 hypothetical protein EXU57_03615 [Segetibacter sp. 3557_3]
MQLLSLLSFCLIAFASCAQSKIAVSNTYGFLRQNSRGALAVDEKGGPINPGPDSQYIAYIEVPSAIEPVWTTAWINKQLYDVSGAKVTSPVIPGTGLNTALKIELAATPGNNLWELSFQKGTPQPLPAKFTSAASTPMIIKALYNKKEMFFEVKSISELDPIIYP